MVASASSWILQVELNPVLNAAAAGLADYGKCVVGLLPMGEAAPAQAGYASWLGIERRHAAAVAILQKLAERVGVVLGCGFEEYFGGAVRVRAQASEPLIGAVRAGVNLPGYDDVPVVSPALDVIAGQSLAMSVLAELELPQDRRRTEPVEIDATNTARNILKRAGGHRFVPPPAGRFETKDGSIVINAGSDEAFQALLDMMNRNDLLSDFRYGSTAARMHNRKDLQALIAPMLAEEATEVWLERLQRYGISACALPEALERDVATASNRTSRVLADLGFRAEQIVSWQQRGVIAQDEQGDRAPTG